VLISGLWGCSGGKTETKLTIAFSNDMIGEIRSCGCAAKDLGGLGRRATFLSGEREGVANLLVLEGGDFFGQDVNYGREKAQLTLEAMAYMEYDAIVPGENELSFGLDFLQERAQALRLPVVACNLFNDDSGERVFPASRIVETRGGLRIGLVGVMSNRLRLPHEAGPVRLDPPQPALVKEVADLAGRVDVVALVAHMPVGEARRLVEAVPEVQLVVCGHEGRPMRQVRRVGNAYILQVADKGRYMGLAEATLDRDRQIVDLWSDVVAMSERFEDEEAIVKLFRSYDLSIVHLEKQRLLKGNLSETRTVKPFGGSESCQPCHEEIYKSWSETAHAHAFDILVGAGRDLDRDCTPCHTTGFYHLGGFESALETPELTNVQCEACHGNGHDHLLDSQNKTPGNSRNVCTDCHNAEQTPDFDFDRFWAKIRHGPQTD